MFQKEFTCWKMRGTIAIIGFDREDINKLYFSDIYYGRFLFSSCL